MELGRLSRDELPGRPASPAARSSWTGGPVQRRLDEHPEKMRQRRETVEHPFGTLKMRLGATYFLMKTLPRVASEMALHVLATTSPAS